MKNLEILNKLIAALIDKAIDRVDGGESIDLVSYMRAALDAVEILEDMEGVK